MAAPKIAIVFYTYKKYADGTHPIMIRITANRKARYIATGYSVKPENWDDENNCLFTTKTNKHLGKKALSNAKAINSDIEQKLSDVIRVKQQVSLSEGSQTSQYIKDKATNKYNASTDFLVYGKKHVDHLIERNKISTAKNISSVLRRIEKYIKKQSLLFDEITVEFLEQYESFLLKGGIKTNTINFHLKTIRAILYKAMKESPPLIDRDKNPFLSIKMKNLPTEKESLSAAEVLKIKRVKLKSPEQQKEINARSYYLFSFNNAGIRISDLIQLKNTNIINGRLHYEMGKTGHFKSIKLNSESLEIIKQYKKRGAKPEDYLFPILDEGTDYSDSEFLRKRLDAKASGINTALKKLAKSCKLNKRLHFHSSRHSFANIARIKKADLYSISKALGHKSLKVTEIYLASFDEQSLDETMEMVLGK
jgi:site-specific recombinase XerD